MTRRTMQKKHFMYGMTQRYEMSHSVAEYLSLPKKPNSELKT